MRRERFGHARTLTPRPPLPAHGERGKRAVAWLSLVVAVITIVGGWAVAACGGDSAAASTVTEATIRIHHSRFDVETLTVPAGVPVTITLVNEDPIGHEWMVGGEAMHERHRTGTEPHHDTIPTEVSLRAYETKVTNVMFEKPGEYRYICHLPGHEQYGMVGVVRVVEG